jgi:hypothetical protein
VIRIPARAEGKTAARVAEIEAVLAERMAEVQRRADEEGCGAVIGALGPAMDAARAVVMLAARGVFGPMAIEVQGGGIGSTSGSCTPSR